MKINDMVLVEWVDSHVAYGWLESDLTNDLLPTCANVGFYLGEDKDKLSLAFGTSESGMHLIKINIPKGCIKNIYKLRKA
jgi:hypothetical protein